MAGVNHAKPYGSVTATSKESERAWCDDRKSSLGPGRRCRRRFNRSVGEIGAAARTGGLAAGGPQWTR